ncbi:MAG TPA: SDR family oxidoreductase [Thiomonas arsenitoxydans]|uniref:SDR family oxidoreductase n=1 Tax=Thiomonas arsenitoxydans (strain DSM 22701 / CIP 110005 / 3As) TaxID=426114 RepID=UPI002CF00A7A|nr:SDR family oxidoreductase [Thiomonas arsenitoxydans]HML83236.1 SDR family oxidoreductase [Thiomonas arsenitoxydans]
MEQLPLVFVTGADRGIGRAIALSALRHGHSIIAASLNAIDDREEFDAASTNGATARFVTFDVRDADVVRRVAAHVTSTAGPIGCLVNVAGIAYFGNVLECTEQEWDETLTTNVKGYFLLSQAVLPGMLEKGEGMIVNLSSIWGLRGSASMMAYSVSKFAVEGLTKSLQEYCRPHGIRVTSVVIDKVDTPFRERMGAKVSFTEEQCRRMLTAEDVASAVIEVIGSSNTLHISTLTLDAYQWR